VKPMAPQIILVLAKKLWNKSRNVKIHLPPVTKSKNTGSSTYMNCSSTVKLAIKSDYVHHFCEHFISSWESADVPTHSVHGDNSSSYLKHFMTVAVSSREKKNVWQDNYPAKYHERKHWRQQPSTGFFHKGAVFQKYPRFNDKFK